MELLQCCQLAPELDARRLDYRAEQDFGRSALGHDRAQLAHARTFLIRQRASAVEDNLSHRALFLQPSGQLQAVSVAQLNVEHAHHETPASGKPPRFVAGVGHPHGKARSLEDAADGSSHHFAIIDDEHRQAHMRCTAPSAFSLSAHVREDVQGSPARNRLDTRCTWLLDLDSSESTH